MKCFFGKEIGDKCDCREFTDSHHHKLKTCTIICDNNEHHELILANKRLNKVKNILEAINDK